MVEPPCSGEVRTVRPGTVRSCRACSAQPSSPPRWPRSSPPPAASPAHSRPRPAARSSRASNPWNRRVDTLPVARNSAASSRSIGAGTACTPTSARASGTARRSGSRYVVVHGAQPKSRVSVRLRRRERPGPVPDPGRRADRGRRALRRRPSRADRRPRRLPPLRAVRPAPQGARLARGLGRDLEPALERGCGPPAGRPPTPPACRSCPASRATTRSPAAGSTTRCASPCERTRRAYVYPARHFASDVTDADLPPMGLRVRLKAC